MLTGASGLAEKAWADNVRRQWGTASRIVVAIDVAPAEGYMFFVAGSFAGLSQGRIDPEMRRLIIDTRNEPLPDALVGLMQRLGKDVATDRGEMPRAALARAADGLRGLSVLAILAGWIAVAVQRRRGRWMERSGSAVVESLFAVVMLLWLLPIATTLALYPAAQTSGACAPALGGDTPPACHAGYVAGNILFYGFGALAAGALTKRFLSPPAPPRGLIQ